MRRTRAVIAGVLLVSLGTISPHIINADDTPPPVLNSVTVSNSVKTTTWTLYPATSLYQILSSQTADGTFLPDNSGTIAGNSWTSTNGNSAQFFRLQVSPVASNTVLGATVLNRLAYGPTPDNLSAMATNPTFIQTYISQQLAPATVTETVDSTHTNIPFIKAKFAEATNVVTSSSANIADLRAWHVLRGIGAQRQLLEILLQFLENHFVTQYSKSQQYMIDNYAYDSTTAGCIATQYEYLENERWRNALLNPACTFYDLLKISAESPAMIIYLDTVISRGNGNQVANENYARELMELFTMGVNNGYDQNDIVLMSRCWTGWYVQQVDPTNASNPFAPGLGGDVRTNNGVWALSFQPTFHYTTGSKLIFPAKTVPARFGPPWAGNPYQIGIGINSTTNGISEGYKIVTNLANLPFTEEFISVKLCNLLVHDGFAIGYDFTDPNLSPEGQLVKSCMMTWETNSPKGQIWLVLSNIVNSDMFRGNSAAAQKVKTPLEYTISAIRALRISTNGSGTNGTFTSDSDGYSISGSTATTTTYPLIRMGTMLLFDREFPNGYPESAEGWISAGTLAERIRWMQTYLLPTGDASKNDGISGGNKSVSNPVLLLQNRLNTFVPGGSMTVPENVADFFLAILFPAEGKANLDQYRTLAINFLNDGSADNPPSSIPFHSLTTANANYDTRVRGMVALLMSFQRFQEQ